MGLDTLNRVRFGLVIDQGQNKWMITSAVGEFFVQFMDGTLILR